MRRVLSLALACPEQPDAACKPASARPVKRSPRPNWRCSSAPGDPLVRVRSMSRRIAGAQMASHIAPSRRAGKRPWWFNKSALRTGWLAGNAKPTPAPRKLRGGCLSTSRSASSSSCTACNALPARSKAARALLSVTTSGATPAPRICSRNANASAHRPASAHAPTTALYVTKSQWTLLCCSKWNSESASHHLKAFSQALIAAPHTAPFSSRTSS
mmetsp:Transcript_104256/g.324143  ORF Transcript_104256/g.324143 Transcript_104256/m.324143 type:complete len:215 (-) Transcript_104256:117-761(-)